jgi:hypothetical protein
MIRDTTSSKPQSSGWHIALDAADTGDDTPYLGDPETIYAIIAMFNAAVVGRQRQIAAGSMAVDDAVAADRGLAERVADILLGQVPGYGLVGEWNSDATGAVADHAASIFHIETEGHGKRDVLAAAWGLHLRAIYAAAASAMRGDDDEAWQAAVSTANDLMASACLGTAWPGAYQGEPHPAATDDAG